MGDKTAISWAEEQIEKIKQADTLTDALDLWRALRDDGEIPSGPLLIDTADFSENWECRLTDHVGESPCWESDTTLLGAVQRALIAAVKTTAEEDPAVQEKPL